MSLVPRFVSEVVVESFSLEARRALLAAWLDAWEAGQAAQELAAAAVLHTLVQPLLQVRVHAARLQTHTGAWPSAWAGSLDWANSCAGWMGCSTTQPIPTVARLVQAELDKGEGALVSAELLERIMSKVLIHHSEPQGAKSE